MLSRSDEDQLIWAFANQRVIYSFNTRDFYRIHTNWLQRGDSHAGIILGQQNYSVGEQMRRILSLISAKSAAQMQNQIEFISDWTQD